LPKSAKIILVRKAKKKLENFINVDTPVVFGSWGYTIIHNPDLYVVSTIY